MVGCYAFVDELELGKSTYVLWAVWYEDKTRWRISRRQKIAHFMRAGALCIGKPVGIYVVAGQLVTKRGLVVRPPSCSGPAAQQLMARQRGACPMMGSSSRHSRRIKPALLTR